MKKFSKKINKTGITARVLFLYITLVFLPFILLVGSVTYVIRQNTITNMGHTTQNTLSATASAIHLRMNSYEEDTMSLYYDGTVDLLAKGGNFTTEEEKQIIESLESSSHANTGVQAVYLETMDGEVFHSGGTYNELEDMMEKHREEILAAGGNYRWYPTNELHGSATRSKYVLARALNDVDKNCLGILYLVISAQMIEDSMGNLSTDYAVWYLTDKYGNVVYSSDQELVGSRLDLSGIDPDRITTSSTIRDSEDGTCIMAATQLMDVHWFCVGKMKLNTINENVQTLILPLLLVSLVYIIFLFLMLNMMRRYIFNPLKQLKQSMDEYATGDLNSTEVSIVGIGEFQSISRHFNSMTRRIAGLMEEYKAEVDEKNRQKMNALTAQLTPHFIYNALNTIKWIAVLNQQETIQKLIESLISIFMNAARADDGGYTVKDELELIANYSVIQKARLMNFDLIIDAQEDCMDCRIRKLMIQPTVENAIVHGLNRGKVRNGKVMVKVWADEKLIISVEDNGVGFDVEKWRNSPEKKRDHTNIGIRNVEEIIALEYGSDYGMEITSIPECGTKVTFILPVIRGEKENDTDNNRG